MVSKLQLRSGLLRATIFLVIVLASVAFSGSEAAAVRNSANGPYADTTAFCMFHSRVIAEGAWSGGGVYVTVEYGAFGNDYARRFIEGGNLFTENGHYIDTNSGCSEMNWNGGSPFWNGRAIDPNSLAYIVAFQNASNAYAGGGIRPRADEVYLGAIGVNYGVYDEAICSAGSNIYWRDNVYGPTRGTYGIDGCPSYNSYLGTVNDAGIVNLGGRTAWCVGMAGVTGDALCRGVDASTIYEGGAAWAGYLSWSNPNAMNNVDGTIRGRIQNGQSINDLIGYTPGVNSNIPLAIRALNTNDGIDPAYESDCWGAPPGKSWTSPFGFPVTCGTPSNFRWDPDGIFQDPWPNNTMRNLKASTVLTFVMKTAAAPNPPPPPPNPPPAPNPNPTPNPPPSGSDFRLVPIAQQPQFVPNSNGTTTVQFRSLIDKSLSTIPYTIDDVEYKRFYFILPPGQSNANSIGARVPLGNWTSGANGYISSPTPDISTEASNRNMFETGVDDEYCLHPASGPTSACSDFPDPGTLLDSFTFNNTSTYMQPGITFCSQLLITPHYGNGGNALNPSDVSWGWSLFPDVSSNPVSASASNSFWSLSAPSCRTISAPPPPPAEKPYFRVYNGDVSAGTSCRTDTDPSSLLAFNTGTPPGANGWGGSGVQLAAYAIGRIEEFKSATLRSAAPTHPKGLTFANTGSGNPGTTYGGGFSGSSCIQDYFSLLSTIPAADVSTVNGSAINLGVGSGALGDGVFYGGAGNSKRINQGVGAGTLAVNQRTTIFVDGDVRIENNVTYANGGWTVATIPNLTLIVKGNIYIDAGVTQLDGVYIAQKRDDGTRGTIYTCSTGMTPPSQSEVVGVCSSNRLVVNGALIADRIKLLRSRGNTTACTNRVTCDSNAGEIINFTPEVWIVEPNGDESIGDIRYDTINAMPPIL